MPGHKKSKGMKMGGKMRSKGGAMKKLQKGGAMMMKTKGMKKGGKMMSKGYAKGGAMKSKGGAKGGAMKGMRKPSNKNSGLFGR